jgi:hypothetical protein
LTLDMLVQLDEPEQLIRELVRVARVRMRDSFASGLGRDAWKAVAEWAMECRGRLDKINEPRD